MARERLSKLQRVILTAYNWKDRGNYFGVYVTIRKEFAKEYDRPTSSDYKDDWGQWQTEWYDQSFRSSFSRTLRNMERKGLLKLEKYAYGDRECEDGSLDTYRWTTRKVSYIKLTKKGKEALMLIRHINNKKKKGGELDGYQKE